MFTGSIVALVTPMKTNGSIDNHALDKLLNLHITSGTDAIILSGTTGESATLEPEEQWDLFKKARDLTQKKIPIIAGTGSNCTQKALFLTQKAKALGVNAALIVTPYYNKPTQEGLYLHYSTIAKAVDIPIILYNIPGRTGCDMAPETVGRLSQIPNIVGIKEAVTGIERLKALQTACRPGFCFYSGDDAAAKDFMLAGGHGVVSVTANVAPAAMKSLCKAALSGQEALATAINDKLLTLHHALFVESNPIPVKWVLEKMGFIPGGIRLPLTWLSPRHEETLYSAMQSSGVEYTDRDQVLGLTSSSPGYRGRAAV